MDTFDFVVITLGFMGLTAMALTIGVTLLWFGAIRNEDNARAEGLIYGITAISVGFILLGVPSLLSDIETKTVPTDMICIMPEKEK